jgi:hypothetical protein
VNCVTQNKTVTHYNFVPVQVVDLSVEPRDITLKTGMGYKKWNQVGLFTSKDVLQRHVLALELLRLSYSLIDNGTFGG